MVRTLFFFLFFDRWKARIIGDNYSGTGLVPGEPPLSSLRGASLRATKQSGRGILRNRFFDRWKARIIGGWFLVGL